ncbi:zf-HC2 domain-containing protein [candidate division KSB1 bacterium]|nr:zf-HC2 domain-containing protein [candidate division KSB1 bacterium]
MKCEEIKCLMMDYLYDEIKADDKSRFMKHMSECEQCRKELIRLQDTSLILNQAEDVDPHLNLVFVQDESSAWSRLVQRFSVSPKRLLQGFAYGLAFVLILLSIINTEVNLRDGEFSVRMSLFRGKENVSTEQQDNYSYAEQAQLAQMQQQHLQLMRSMITESENKQRQQLISTLAQFSRDINSQRTNDLQIMNAGLNEIEKSLHSKIEQQTNNQFNSLIHYINAQQGNR